MRTLMIALALACLPSCVCDYSSMSAIVARAEAAASVEAEEATVGEPLTEHQKQFLELNAQMWTDLLDHIQEAADRDA